MCGIVGWVGQPADQRLLNVQMEQACFVLSHRGPNDVGTYVTDGLGLGVRRLAIRDPENGHQPISAVDGTTIVFNGELYGIRGLRSELQLAGYSFRTTSDTEVLLQGYRTYGLNVLHKIHGMFAFAIWDAPQRRLVLARDHFGEKPLYIASTSWGFAFASEAKGLKLFDGINWAIDYGDLTTFLQYGYMATNRTGWSGVQKLPPGHVLIWENGQHHLYPYYSPPLPATPAHQPPDVQTTAKKLRHLLEQAVHSCMESDRPVGAFLSGGLDSASIVALMAQHVSTVPVFSVGWTESECDESVYAAAVARSFGCSHEIVYCSYEYVRDNFDRILSFFDEPLTDSSSFPMTLLAKIAKSKVDVVLTGDGGDEMFGGYKKYFLDVPFEQYDNICRVIPDAISQRILTDERMRGVSSESLLAQYYKQCLQTDTISARRWVDLHTFLPCQILPKLDRTTMSVGLESRAPFLHPTITSWALQCDPRIITQGKVGKYILRIAMSDLIPTEILDRAKQGFRAPIKRWFQEELYDWVYERLLEGRLGATCWFNQYEIEMLLLEHRQNRVNHSRTIFTLLTLESWLRQNV